ncbi:YihY/virulence factor BrkB family protein [Aquimarina sp. MMG016]|uniref:YihY/virulence factor BrkB family protein n=1 Tax=Aquimarina sp. MMG016 TaxID=2822690 RepID=UPI001B3A3C0D|nr:YihY/virulence factor BrkB family protein [Aquimarina sp. MMG016]MBQ4820574.1 YihY/virulence factor BrkB family protein [Aquimarina sp. MMG016]
MKKPTTINIKSFFRILTTTYKNWSSNEPFQMSAAVSYYSLFSFPALLIIIIQVTGLFYEKREVKGKIIKEISEVLGIDAANTVEVMLKNAVDQEQSTLVIIIGIITLLYGATGMFIALQKSLNTIWRVKPKPKNEILKMIKDRIFSLGLILMIGFLLLTSLVLTALITATTDWISQHFPDFILYAIQVINFVLSLLLTTVLFAFMFKILPDVTMRWKDVWLGAFITTILFSIGKSALGIYFGTVNPGSTFGAAGSVILILLWVSYSSLILFFGAEFTRILASKYGAGIQPASYAEKVD